MQVRKSLIPQTAQIVLHKACVSAKLPWLIPYVRTLPNRQQSRACSKAMSHVRLLAGLLSAPAEFGRTTTSQLDGTNTCQWEAVETHC